MFNTPQGPSSFRKVHICNVKNHMHISDISQGRHYVVVCTDHIRLAGSTVTMVSPNSCPSHIEDQEPVGRGSRSCDGSPLHSTLTTVLDPPKGTSSTGKKGIFKKKGDWIWIFPFSERFGGRSLQGSDQQLRYKPFYLLEGFPVSALVKFPNTCLIEIKRKFPHSKHRPQIKAKKHLWLGLSLLWDAKLIGAEKDRSFPWHWKYVFKRTTTH